MILGLAVVALLLLLGTTACAEEGRSGALRRAAEPEPGAASGPSLPAPPGSTGEPAAGDAPPVPDAPASPTAKAPASPPAAVSPVQRAGGDWTTAAPEDHGLDPEQVAAGVREIAAQAGVRTLLVVAGGELVVEEAWAGASTRRRTNVKSASKSLLSALAGIDLAAGRLPGLDATLATLLPDALPEDGGGRGDVALRHLLTMTTGLEPTSGPHYGAWVSAGNWTRAALARPVAAPPGERFLYSSGNTHVLAAILEEATGTDLLDHARRRLFDPLGIGEVSWQESPEGVRFGGNNLSMSPRDLARFGLLALQRGRWGDGEVVPAEWMERATRRQVETPPAWAQRYGDYGYLWWIPRGHPPGTFLAVGYGGQLVYVAPEAGVVVVLTSTREGKGAAWDRRVLEIFRDRFAGAAG